MLHKYVHNAQPLLRMRKYLANTKNEINNLKATKT